MFFQKKYKFNLNNVWSESKAYSWKTKEYTHLKKIHLTKAIFT